MLNDLMIFFNINADPGATSKQKSFANDILRKEFTPGVADRGGSAKTYRYFKLYEEQCLKAMLGASAKTQENMHLGSWVYGNGGGVGSSNNSSSSNINGKKSGAKMESHPNRHQGTRQQGNNPNPRSKPRATTSETRKKDSPKRI